MIEIAGLYLGLALIFGCGYGVAHTPPIRLFGTEKAVYGIDCGSLACKADNVYGGFADTVAGVQCAGFMTKTKALYGVQTSMLCLGEDVHGCQLGIVNKAKRIDGIQIGVYNEASAGECLQLGVVNCMPSRKIEYLPILNLRFK